MSEAKRVDALQGEIVHVYDGIEEADNNLPLWWLFTFYLGIVVAVFYWFSYEGFHLAQNPGEAYGAEMSRRAAAGGVVTDDILDAIASDPAQVARGRGIFEQHCVVCHAAQAQGNIGPNLTDAMWLHGGAPTDIHTTIRDGVTSKGMPNWGPPLGAASVRSLTAYVLSIRGTNVPGKAPEGAPFSRGGATQ
jgi:cytochrome c oxidase cbb3-type subunit 3